MSRIPDEGYVVSPKYSSINQKVAEEQVNARRKAGLTHTQEDPKSVRDQPGLNWVYKPDPKTCEELVNQRRVTNLEQLK